MAASAASRTAAKSSAAVACRVTPAKLTEALAAEPMGFWAARIRPEGTAVAAAARAINLIKPRRFTLGQARTGSGWFTMTASL